MSDLQQPMRSTLQSLPPGEAVAVLEQLASLPSTCMAPDSASRSVPSRNQLTSRSSWSSEARYRALVEQIPAVVFMAFLDEGTCEAYVSPQIERVLGFSQAEWLEDPVLWYQQLHPDDKERWSTEAASMFRCGTPMRSVFRVIARDGQIVWFHCEAKMVQSPHGGPSLIHGSAFDITELKSAEEALQQARDELEARVAERTKELAQANSELQFQIKERYQVEEALRQSEEQLRQAQKMEAIGRLAGGIAHDFNNLLTAILGYSDFLLNALGSNDALRNDVSEIRKAGERASKLTNQLLAFSRKQLLRPTLLDLNEVVGDMNNMLRRLIGEDIDFVSRCGASLGVINADPGGIEQIILNLVVNARDAMPDGGSLMVETANVDLDESYAHSHIEVQAGPFVMLAVSDTGMGMSPETQARIFEPFFTTKEKGKGSGLGLSTVYGIARQSGGHLWVYSELGRGTTFKVYFPRVGKAQAVARPNDPKVSNLDGSETILVVEDENAILKLVSTVLERHGYTVITASNGFEAIANSERHSGPIHLMVTDVIMPQMSVRELTQHMARIYPQTQVLYISGYTDDAIVHQGVLDEGLNFIQKPFNPSVLLQKVREILDRI